MAGQQSLFSIGQDSNAPPARPFVISTGDIESAKRTFFAAAEAARQARNPGRERAMYFSLYKAFPGDAEIRERYAQFLRDNGDFKEAEIILANTSPTPYYDVLDL